MASCVILAKHLDECDRGVAQLGSALLWGSRGRRFKSCRSDRLKAVQLKGCAAFEF